MNNKFKKAFDQIHADETLKASTLDFLREEREKNFSQHTWKKNTAPVKTRIGWARTAVVFCLLFILIGGTCGYQYTLRPYAYISIDINPSLELTLNKNNKVIRATAYNQDGENILKGLDVKGMLYTDAVKKIMTSGKMKKYLGNQYRLVITTASGEKKEFSSAIKKSLQGISEQAEYIFTDLSDVKEAHSHHCSIGKYTAYKELSEYESDLSVDDCEDMSVDEIHDKVEEHEEECEHESGKNEEEGTCCEDTTTENATEDNQQQEEGHNNDHEEDEENHEECHE